MQKLLSYSLFPLIREVNIKVCILGTTLYFQKAITRKLFVVEHSSLHQKKQNCPKSLDYQFHPRCHLSSVMTQLSNEIFQVCILGMTPCFQKTITRKLCVVENSSLHQKKQNFPKPLDFQFHFRYHSSPEMTNPKGNHLSLHTGKNTLIFKGYDSENICRRTF